MMKKNYLLYSFFIVVVLLSVLDILKPDKTFSDLENRNLKQKVKFTVDAFWDNSFQQNYESYINDQFIFRDGWIDIKSRSEYCLGKIENNGIIYGDKEYLFEKYSSFDNTRFLNNIEAIKIFKDKVPSKVSLMIAPNSYEIYKELVPKAAPLVPQEENIEYIYENIVDTNNINLSEIMKENKNEYIYYRTDHHWTVYGAYLAYKEFVESIGEIPIKLEEGDVTKVDNFYGTYFSKAKPFNVEPDIFSYLDVSGVTMSILGEEYDSIYDYSQLELRDKYALFLKGNNALTVIKNSNLSNGKKIAVIKDSYANSLVPYLTQNFEEIHVIDLRTFKEKVDQYINNNNIQDVLILYNFINFTRDVNIIRLKY